MPNVGILEAGASASIEITGRLTATLNGLTRAQFKAVSFGSQESTLAMVNTTFYYCIEVGGIKGGSRILSAFVGRP